MAEKLNVAITLGPTDESIDDIMKMTNMSTGALGVAIAKALAAADTQKRLQLYLVCNKAAYLMNRVEMDALLAGGAKMLTIGGLKGDVRITSETDDLLDVLEKLYADVRVDWLFHCAAVGDYTGKFATSARLLAREIFALREKEGDAFIEDAIFEVLKQPKSVFNQDTKMSSDEPEMIVGLALTPKVIARIVGFAQAGGYETRMVSWKLLSGVPQEELYDVALQHGRRNKSYLVVANDLDRIQPGEHWAMIIDVASGEKREVFTKDEIADTLAKEVLGQ